MPNTQAEQSSPVLQTAGRRSVSSRWLGRFSEYWKTSASLLIQQAESLAYVKDQLGHSSIQITVDTYGHLVPGGNRQAVDRLDDLEADENDGLSDSGSKMVANQLDRGTDNG